MARIGATLDVGTDSGERKVVAESAYQLPAELRDRAGQMMMVGFRGLTPLEAQPTIRHLAEGSVGAVVLFDVDAETAGPRNVQSPEQLRTLVSSVKAAGEIPALVCVDAEGGFYHRLKERYGFPSTSPAAEMGERDDLAFTHRAAGVVADTLADMGIDLNLAPVVDLLNPANLTVSARRRSFSSDPARATAHAREFIMAHHERGVLAAPKHFPGMGGLLRPYLPDRGEFMEGWTMAELEPYRALAAEGLLDAVLAARVSHPELDPVYPSCLSRTIVEGVLRDQLGFGGVVISDAMEMLAIWDVYGFERGTILAVNAGVDMLLYCNESGIVPYSDERGPDAVEVIVNAVARGEIPEERVNQACSRVLALKSRLV